MMKVFQYGLRRSHAKAITMLPQIMEQMRLARRYRNSLAEMERERRRRKQEIRERYEWEEITDLKNQQKALNAEMKALRQAIKDRNKAERRKDSGTQEERARLASLKGDIAALAKKVGTLYAAMPQVDWDTIQELRNELKEEKVNKQDTLKIAELEARIRELRRVDPAFAEQLALEEWHKKELMARRFKAKEGTWSKLPHEQEAPTTCLFWCNYQAIEEDYARMVKAKDAPTFRAWRGEGRIHFHFQNREVKTWKELKEGNNNKLALTHVRGKIWRAKLWFASAGKGKPIYTEFDFVLHREPELDARISWAILQREIVGNRDKWTFSLVVDQPECLQRGAGIVVANIAWALRDGGDLRCLYVTDDNGIPVTLVEPHRDGTSATLVQDGEALIPARMVRHFRHNRELQRIRDQNFNEIKVALAEGLRDIELSPDQIALFAAHEINDKGEEDRAQKVTTKPRLLTAIVKWRSKPRLVNLIHTLLPMKGPPPIPLSHELSRRLIAYAAWPGEPRLRQWQICQRKKFEAWRLDFYRRIAAALRKRYARLIVEDTDYRELAMSKEAEYAKDKGVNKHKDVVSPSLLRQTLKSVMPWIQADHAGTTLDCHLCGHHHREGGRKGRVPTCENCHEEADVDYRACMNLLARGKVLDEMADTARNAA